MDPIIPIEPVVESRRDQISTMFDNAEKGEPLVSDTPAEPTAAERARDESGRFASKAKTEAAPVAAEPAVVPEVPIVTTPTLTTWRKEYLPIQEKLAKGETLNAEEARKLAAYNVEREKQYSTGISTYKGEAAQAKQFTDAMSEFLPLLQQHNMSPATWIQNLGRAHQQLALGNPEQKLQMFAKLAQDYGVPLAAVGQAQQGKVDPVTLQLMQEIQKLQNNVSGITSWRQQQEDALLNQEVAKFKDATKYPHFEQVRESMIQLLESGVAQNPDEAYQHAIWTNADVRALELAKLTQPQTHTANIQKIAVGKAKAAGSQVRSSAPSGSPSATAAKDRRSALAAAFEATDNTGRV